MTTTWYDTLRPIASLGATAPRPGSLAGLHSARQVTLGQFFTPDHVARFMWQIAAPAIESCVNSEGVATIFDNSFGSGRLFQFADPARHHLYGIEVHQPLVDAVAAATRAAGFAIDLRAGSMEDFTATGMDVGLINPPFSIQLDTQHGRRYPCGAYGAFGPKSSCKSHLYALAQAREACDVVVALMPATFTALARNDAFWQQRLRAIYQLPPQCFRAETTDVDVAIVVYGPSRSDALPVDIAVADLAVPPAPLPGITLERDRWSGRTPAITAVDHDASEPAVTLPVTGDRRVRITRNGRKLLLGFACGRAQGRVLNKILREDVFPTRRRDARLPDCVTFRGQGRLDLENYVAQDDPLQAWDEFLELIARWGFQPEPDPGIRNWLARAARRTARHLVPFRHTIYRADGGLAAWLRTRTEPFTATCVAAYAVGGPDSPRMPVGATVSFTPGEEDRFTYRHEYRSYTLTSEQLARSFVVDGFTGVQGWHVAHEGLQAAFPEQWRAMEARARALGLDRWLTWGYQWYDCIEFAVKRGGAIAAWEMGLGKARLATALALLGGGTANLLVVEARLIDEMKAEFRALGLPSSRWQVIDGPEDLAALRTINVISYSKLRARLSPRLSPKRTFAGELRRRIHTCICDEGHCLRNGDTDQTQAVWQISPKVRYILSGTPISNYPRDLLPLLQWLAGDGTARQPFGIHHPCMRQENLHDLADARRGIDVFRQLFVTTTWVTNEFADSLQKGAKREIPKIADVLAFRRMAAPFIKRRILEEPDVAEHLRIPRSERFVRTIEWDLEHLVYYHEIATSFAEWYRRLRPHERANNLIAILAKIQAVQFACNCPQFGFAGAKPFTQATSKQRYALQRLAELTRDGHKTILFAHSPTVLDWMHARLAQQGIDSVLFHGGITIARRVADLDRRFRRGDAPVLLASTGACQTGYNIYQADRVVMYDRDWTPKTEFQAIARVLRPQQRRPVEIEYLHLDGSIDSYQDQMCAFKATAMRAGLDWGNDDVDADDFVHLETILGRFVEDVEAKLGCRLDDLRRGDALRAS